MKQHNLLEGNTHWYLATEFEFYYITQVVRATLLPITAAPKSKLWSSYFYDFSWTTSLFETKGIILRVKMILVCSRVS